MRRCGKSHDVRRTDPNKYQVSLGLLNADFSLNCDGGMLGPDQPTIVYGLRGGAISTIRIFGPSLDIHDGLFGGVIENPIHVLSNLIAGFHDGGRVTLPRFYEKVRYMEEEERAELARLPIDNSFYLKSTGAPSIWGDDEFTPVERVGARPALTVTMFQAGSRKGAIPSKAEARVSMRLIPNQDPLEVHEQLKEYVAQNAPSTVTWEVEYEEGWQPSISDRMYAGNEALRQALETVWRKKPYYHLDGGGIPVVGQLKQILGMDSVVTGFSLPDDNIHGPNEKIHLPTVRRGIESLIHFFHILSKE
jgi:acetylornithine deacetylase/succinyl-diaminopimelate desuccinylase-like protein